MYSKHDENIGDELTTLATRTEPQHNTTYKTQLHSEDNNVVVVVVQKHHHHHCDCWAKLQDSLTQNFNP